MPEQINWSAVLQSITDTWLPLLSTAAVVALLALIIWFFQRRGK